MPQLAANEPPPPDYYADNVGQILSYVEKNHGDLLTTEERDFITCLQGISVSAQRLYARLVSRKGPWIRADKLSYSEVPDIVGALAELSANGLIEMNPSGPADALLHLLTRGEQARLFPRVRAPTKPLWIEACTALYTDHTIRDRISAAYTWLVLSSQPQLKLCQLLFFGDEYQDLSTFVIQDLGLVRYEDYSLQKTERQFDDRAQLERYLYLRNLRRLSHRVTQHPDLAPLLVDRLMVEPCNRMEQRQLDKISNRLGYFFERRGDFDEALACYGHSRTHPGGERIARVLKRLGDDAGVELMLQRMKMRPRSAEEEDFAERFGQRGLKPDIPITTKTLTGDTPIHIEQHAMEVLTRDGGQAWHLENHFPLGVAGLLFWNVVFAPVKGAFLNPFQSGPVDLGWSDFARVRAQVIEETLTQLSTNGAVYHILKSTWAAKQGVANKLVSWRHFDRDLLDAVLEVIPESSLLDLAYHVLTNLYRARTGFPDLLVIYEAGRYEFVEVKGPEDQLQPGQRIWFKSLKRLGLPARVLKFKR